MRHVVVMGVAGCGKSTVAKGISACTGYVFAEADEFHSVPNVARMSSGLPLDDADRQPWLLALAGWLAARHAAGESTVLACSALRREYRDVLRTGAPSVDFVHLGGPATVIRTRLSQRSGHYMPVSLLDSQLATLEPLQPGERGIVLDSSMASDDLVTAAIRLLALP